MVSRSVYYYYFYSCEEDLIDIDELVNIMTSYWSLTSNFKDFRDKIIKKFIGLDSLRQINKRKDYYDKLHDNDTTISLPQESCLVRFTRNIIYKEPPPYYSDYRDKNIEYRDIMSNLILSIRGKFGYSKRPERMPLQMAFHVPLKTSHASSINLSFPTINTQKSIPDSHFK